MKYSEISEIFEQAAVHFPECSDKVDSKPWYSPPGWKGVFLKDLITGKDTDGKFSYHLVRIQDHCEVPNHSHETQWEWNAILSGEGTFLLEQKIIPARIGEIFTTPPGKHHTVKAGNKDLALMAVFVPALV